MDTVMKSEQDREMLMKAYFDFLNSTKISGDEPEEKKRIAREKLYCLMSKFMPPVLYRYRKGEGGYDSAISEDKAYFSRPKDFNDPHDCLMYVDPKAIEAVTAIYGYDNAVNALESIIKNKIVLKDSRNMAKVVEIANSLIGNTPMTVLLDRIEFLRQQPNNVELISELFGTTIDCQRNKNQRSAREDIFVGCFSEGSSNLNEGPTSTTMWAHYADYHKGFALAYDTRELALLSNKCIKCTDECECRHITMLYPVQYSEKRYDATEYEVETLKAALAYRFNMGNGFTEPDIFHWIKLFTSKGLDWEYEHEWRTIYEPNPLTLTPENKIRQAYEEIRPLAIYFGCEMKAERKDALKKLIHRNKGRSIAMYEMSADNSIPECKIKCAKVVQ